MALLNKLFSPTTPSSPAANISSTSSPSSALPTSAGAWTSPISSNKTSSSRNCKPSAFSTNYLSQFPFDGRQVRVLLYRECDSRGRRLLFDSNALQKASVKDPGNGRQLEKLSEKSSASSDVNNKGTSESSKHQLGKGHSNNITEVNKEYIYKHTRPNGSDVVTFGEMVFGALAMSFRGTALKVHWLHAPARILCSQVFLTPISTGNNQSPNSTISVNSLTSPRASISSEQGSLDGISMNSFSMPFSLNIAHTLAQNDRFLITNPLDVPAHKTFAPNSELSRAESGARYSSTYSTVTDSGYSGISGMQFSSDQWTGSRQNSTRSSIGSVLSDPTESLRKLSMDSALFPLIAHNTEVKSDSSLQRRICRNLRTSFENEHSINDFIGFLSDNGAVNNRNGGSEGGSISISSYRRASYSAQETRSNPEIGKKREFGGNKPPARRAKLGLAVCITMSESFEEEMELFCSEHIALLETMLSRLRVSTERAYLHHKDFLQTMCQAWKDAQQWLNDLFTAPRIKCPMWLGITTSGSKYSKNIAERFIKELCWLLSFADTKDTNFFISTMLTAVLTNHLGWVSTVSSFNSSSPAFETAAVATQQRAALLKVSQHHPYNALWAQLGDIYGANGFPPRIARTIIYGTEKLSVERLLNTLTYFIRCGEVRRCAKCEDFAKDLINSEVCQNNNEILKRSTSATTKNFNKKTALTRTQTCTQHLNIIMDLNEGHKERNVLQTLKKNEIPNVLAFRDSRFVQQELRIGNYLMDTGIEKNSQNRQQRVSSQAPDKPIRLMLTTPDNVEMNVEDAKLNSIGSSIDGALEAIEIDADLYSNNAANDRGGKQNFLWNIVPAQIKDGLSLNQMETIEINHTSDFNDTDTIKSSNFVNHTEVGNTREAAQEAALLRTNLSNQMGGKWGIDPIKENSSWEEERHDDLCLKTVENHHDIFRDGTESKSDVVFVLGDNEPLVNLKKSMEDIHITIDQFPEKKPKQLEKLCSIHQNTLTTSYTKKHSAVKFNFEQFPQIATNYMKSKNLVLANYQLLMDKCAKLDEIENTTNEQQAVNYKDAAVNCLVCRSYLNLYQTPSNATEHEFETDDIPVTSGQTLYEVNSTTSMDTLKSTDELHSDFENKVLPYASNNKFSSHRGSLPYAAINRLIANETVHMLKLPIPGTKKQSQEDDPPADMKLRAGFIPSLFLSVSDHYISDVVLQGTYASPAKWEMSLRDDLALAAHSVSFISQPAENIAIVADMEKWDVRLISSQSQYFPFAGGQSAPVGMSQLVSSMLETVQVMNNIGIPAYECLAYLESKLREIYLQSETLAAFLLETDFCPLSTVTSSLNLTENDVPLLLSVASIHTPQISKKCGISFR